jgi:hypothetical protein
MENAFLIAAKAEPLRDGRALAWIRNGYAMKVPRVAPANK